MLHRDLGIFRRANPLDDYRQIEFAADTLNVLPVEPFLVLASDILHNAGPPAGDEQHALEKPVELVALAPAVGVGVDREADRATTGLDHALDIGVHPVGIAAHIELEHQATVGIRCRDVEVRLSDGADKGHRAELRRRAHRPQRAVRIEHGHAADRREDHRNA